MFLVEDIFFSLVALAALKNLLRLVSLKSFFGLVLCAFDVVTIERLLATSGGTFISIKGSFTLVCYANIQECSLVVGKIQVRSSMSSCRDG